MVKVKNRIRAILYKYDIAKIGDIMSPILIDEYDYEVDQIYQQINDYISIDIDKIKKIVYETFVKAFNKNFIPNLDDDIYINVAKEIYEEIN